MKKLLITYGDMTLFDGEVAELTWVDSTAGIKVEGRLRSVAKGQGLLEVIGSGLASAQKGKTAARAQELTGD